MAFDFPNWVALIIEIGIAVPFAIYLFSKQRKNSRQIEQIIFRQEFDRKMRHDFGIIIIRSHLEGLKETLKEVNSQLEQYQEKGNPEDNMEHLNEIWDVAKEFFSRDIKYLKNIINIISDVLDPIESQQIIEVCMKISDPQILPLKEAHIAYCFNIINKIDNILNYLDAMEKKKSHRV